jgi:hypothetical protein
VALAVSAALAGGLAWSGRRGASADTAGAPVQAETAAVVTTDLSVTESLTGTLGFGGAQPVKGGRDGIVTWLPRPGASIKRGQQLYRADDQPVPLFYGTMPLYRDLSTRGTVGRDVRIVADNLRALGYPIGRQPGPGETVTRTTPASTPAQPAGKQTPAKPPATTSMRVTVRKGEGTLTRTLIAAVKRWQNNLGLPASGRIGAGDVVVWSGAVRVDAVTAQRGDSAATPLLTVTSTRKVVTADADPTQAGTIRRGDRVSVVLPGDQTVPGKVSGVSTAVREDEEAGEPKRSVTVTVDDQGDLRGLDAAKVQVDLAGETREGVLAVPVGALIALSEGGYAVQESGTRRLIAVETGLFAQGLVEVTGNGLTEGLPVVTTS